MTESFNDIATIVPIQLKQDDTLVFDQDQCFIFTDKLEAEKFYRLYGFVNCECKLKMLNQVNQENGVVDNIGLNNSTTDDSTHSPLKEKLTTAVSGMHKTKKRPFNFISNTANPNSQPSKLASSIQSTSNIMRGQKRFKLNSFGAMGQGNGNSGIGLTKAQVRVQELSKLSIADVIKMKEASKQECTRMVAELQQKMEDKADTLRSNKKYYGERCQDLLNEILCRQPVVPDTGAKNTMTQIIKKLGIDADAIKFNIEDDDFQAF
eukprot:403363719